ncbi:MAG: hypothetical protein QE285_14805 [Aquabacterium sp.]|nr:hypothetical protein [Aquabacterium sp.]
MQMTEAGQPICKRLSQQPFAKQLIQIFAEHSLAAPATLMRLCLVQRSTVTPTGANRGWMTASVNSVSKKRAW